MQIEGVVTHSEVTFRPRRQLLVTLQDDSDVCILRFFNFYPSQQKQLAVGERIRARGELRGGMFGWQMLHPVCKAAGGNLPTALTPVYSTVAGLSQPYLRRAVLTGLEQAARSGALDETIPAAFLSQNAPFAQAKYARGATIFALPRTRCVCGAARRPQPPGLAAAQV